MEKQSSALLIDSLLLPLMCIAISVRDVKCSTVQRLVPLEILTVCQLINSGLTQPLSFFFDKHVFHFSTFYLILFKFAWPFFYNCLFLVLFFNCIFHFLIILYPLFHNSKTWSPWESKYADCCFCLRLFIMALFPSLVIFQLWAHIWLYPMGLSWDHFPSERSCICFCQKVLRECSGFPGGPHAYCGNVGLSSPTLQQSPGLFSRSHPTGTFLRKVTWLLC